MFPATSAGEITVFRRGQKACNIVTGGAGFIGSNLVHEAQPSWPLPTYLSSITSLIRASSFNLPWRSVRRLHGQAGISQRALSEKALQIPALEGDFSTRARAWDTLVDDGVYMMDQQPYLLQGSPRIRHRGASTAGSTPSTAAVYGLSGPQPFFVGPPWENEKAG